MTGDKAANQAMDRANMARFACRSHDHVQTLLTLLPPMGPIDAFERFATGWVARRRNGDQQAATFARMRNTLLPKLINADLRVNDAERFIEVNA